MEILVGISCGIIGLILLATVLLAPLKYKYWKEIRTKGKEELEKEVFYFAEEYFSFVGYQNAEVQQFRELINKKDVVGIKANWKRLSKSFATLERKAGHKGRPLILDYYCWYEMCVNELRKRNT
jgi:hypothetical protein